MGTPSKIKRFVRSPLLLAALLLLAVGSLVFRDFLFGNQVLLYTDIGSDSVNDYYPWFVHFSDYLRREGFPSWSFHVGMGQDIFYLSGYLIWQPVVWLSRNLIAYALVYQHLAKVLLAGLFFFRFLQLLRLSLPASLLGSLLVSFSAYMCMGSCWFTLADEVVGYAALLLAVEETLQHGRWFLVSIAIAFVSFLGSFYLYLGALLLTCYVPLRLFARQGWQPRRLWRGCLRLSTAAILGVGVSAVFTVPHVYAIFNSPRGSGVTSLTDRLKSFSIFGLESPLHYVTAVWRLLANDALGTGDDFHGWKNYLEAPLTYCGLICVILLPQVFVGSPRRHRIVYGLFLAGIVISTIFPWFRYLFWVFQGDYYRTLSLFSILGLLTLAMTVVSRYSQGRSLSFSLLGPSLLILAAAPFLPGEWHSRLNADPSFAIAIFVVLYGLILTAGQLWRRQRFAAWLVLGIAIIELVYFDHFTVSNRKAVTTEEWTARVGYNDQTIEAVRDIEAGDTDKFYRITKLRPSGPSSWPSFNDAMIFGYYGTSCYSSFNNVNYTNFLTAVDAIPPNSEADTRWSSGLLDDPILSLFAGEKYALVEDPIPFQRAAQYEFVKRYDRDYLFRNARFLPLGLTFDRYIPEDIFLKLVPREKPEVLLRAVVLSHQSEAEKLGLSPIVLVDLEQEIRNSSLAEVVAARRQAALDLTRFQQTRIEGKVVLERKSVLVVQTPFDRGWHALQDGRAAPVLKVDVGLLGVALDAGEHRVELSYRNPYLAAGMTVSLASLLIFAAGVWRWPRFGAAA